MSLSEEMWSWMFDSIKYYDNIFKKIIKMHENWGKSFFCPMYKNHIEWRIEKNLVCAQFSSKRYHGTVSLSFFTQLFILFGILKFVPMFMPELLKHIPLSTIKLFIWFDFRWFDHSGLKKIVEARMYGNHKTFMTNDCQQHNYIGKSNNK